MESAKPELLKLQRLKSEFGELKPTDERKYIKLLRETEAELLNAADVICTTCAGAGDRRLAKFRFRQVSVVSCLLSLVSCLLSLVDVLLFSVIVSCCCVLFSVVCYFLLPLATCLLSSSVCAR